MRRSYVPFLLLVAACSSGTRTTATSSPSDALPTELSPTPSATASASPSPSATVTHAVRMTPSPTPSPKASPAPRPHRTRTPSPKPSPTPAVVPPAKTYGISEVTGDRFSPSTLALRVGDSVLVTDKDTAFPHTFTITALHVDSGGMNQGDTFRYRFLKAGTFEFICDYHKDVGMTGKVTVKP